MQCAYGQSASVLTVAARSSHSTRLQAMYVHDDDGGDDDEIPDNEESGLPIDSGSLECGGCHVLLICTTSNVSWINEECARMYVLGAVPHSHEMLCAELACNETRLHFIRAHFESGFLIFLKNNAQPQKARSQQESDRADTPSSITNSLRSCWRHCTKFHCTFYAEIWKSC